MEFSQQDLAQIKALGKTPEEVEAQLDRFINGFPDLQLHAAVSPGNGIVTISGDQLKDQISTYESNSQGKQMVKLVPASGAASRMFKTLYNFLEGHIDENDKDIKLFYDGIKHFAFFDELKELLGEDADNLIRERNKKVIDYLLSAEGLNYGSLPKALLTFHKNADGTLNKAIDEHLIEGAHYCFGSDNKVALHLTVSEEHIEPIKAYLSGSVPVLEKQFNKKYSISFSIQDKATDTIAVDLNNKAIRNEDGELLFRPGGHGALLKNLNSIDADIIFIKNVDNVAAQWMIEDTINYKKALGGILLETQNKVFDYCNELDKTETIEAGMEDEMIQFLQTRLGYKVSDNFFALKAQEKKSLLFKKLHRPLRVCGVVQSSGTGGGPFWIRHNDGAESLQLVETAQVNLENKAQVSILDASQYANITDLVCGVKDYKGIKFDLESYSDPDTGFIAEKSQGGKALKAMELPGLWNGAMSDWNTVFIEVPVSTFNPVKTVLDLLNTAHQGK